jgi:hypothetical protein
VRRVPRSAPDPEDEQPSASLAQGGKTARHGVDLFALDRSGELGRGLEVTLRMFARRHAGNPSPAPGR